MRSRRGEGRMGFAGFAAVANSEWAGRRGIYFCVICFEVDDEGFHVTGKVGRKGWIT
jgi:hypothetical protein